MSRTRIDPSLLNNLSSNLNLGSNKIVSLANGSASTDAAAYGQLHILQTPVNATNITQSSTTSTTFVATNLTASITPTSSSSKVLILVSGNLDTNNNSADGDATLYRNSTTNLGSAQGFVEIGGPNTDLRVGAAIVYLDSPATTSSTTYTVYIRSNASAATTVTWGQDDITTSIVLIEVA